MNFGDRVLIHATLGNPTHNYKGEPAFEVHFEIGGYESRQEEHIFTEAEIISDTRPCPPTTVFSYSGAGYEWRIQLLGDDCWPESKGALAKEWSRNTWADVPSVVMVAYAKRKP